MSSEALNETATWRERYHATCDALETVRALELAGMTEARAREIIQTLGTATPWRERSDWSGLVEQQALFHGLPRG
jgi:hypothetical protein